MNKLERRLKGYYKYKKRLKNYNLTGTVQHALRTTGKPCSCFMCSPGKTEEKPKYKASNNKDHHSIIY